MRSRKRHGPQDCDQTCGAAGSQRCAFALTSVLSVVIMRFSRGRANVLTLSCKNRLTWLPQKAARRLPRLTLK